jgi:SAM-dependent MidA family methyltransferase
MRIIQEATTQSGGVLPFARFMELALYTLGVGYYEQAGRTPGRRGDFFTSVSVGCLFGELLGFQFSRWLAELAARQPEGRKLALVEGGAHDGRLAADILGWFRQFQPQLLEQIRYVIIEPSAARRSWQSQSLAGFAPIIQWHESWTDLTDKVSGIIFSSELLDAFPVHRLGWDKAARRWFEWGVNWTDERLKWARCEALPPSLLAFDLGEPLGLLGELPDGLLDLLPDMFTIELSPAAVNWWKQAGSALDQGWLLAFDYGLSGEEVLRPERVGGTLRAYHRHAQADDLLANPGDQDLTAHVNFSALRAAGAQAGLDTGEFLSQGAFLSRLLPALEKEPELFPRWSAARRRQFQTLTHPDFLGHSFKVLAQGKRDWLTQEGTASSNDRRP